MSFFLGALYDVLIVYYKIASPGTSTHRPIKVLQYPTVTALSHLFWRYSKPFYMPYTLPLPSLRLDLVSLFQNVPRASGPPHAQTISMLQPIP